MRRNKRNLRDFYQIHLQDWMASLLLAPLCLYFALNREHYTLLDNADLIIHEAGHVFFMLLGPFLRIAGGTLMQILLPSILVGYFYANHYRFGTQVSLFWLGHHFINISVYAADARARVLPLLGGDKAGHDWANMLGLLGLLDYDQIVGGFFYVLALLTFVALLALPRYMLKITSRN